MHAVVGIWTLDEALREEQLRVLHEEVVPRTVGMPGFVCGHWTHDPETGKAHSMIIFSSSRAASNFKALVTTRSQAIARLGVTNDILSSVDVVASAPNPSGVV
jgi:hypothetical protein